MITFFKEKLDAGYLQRLGDIFYVLMDQRVQYLSISM